MSEEWTGVRFWSWYEVSTLGRVRNVTTGKILKPVKNSTGYMQVTLCDGIHRKNRKIHWLVLYNFVGPPPTSNHNPAHADGNQENNRLDNLSWKTHRDNCADRIAHGTNGRKLNLTDVAEIRLLATYGFSNREIADRLMLHITTIWGIVTGRNWRTA